MPLFLTPVKWLFLPILALLLIFLHPFVYRLDATRNELDALNWLKANARQTDTIVADNHYFLDLPEFNVNWYTKAEFDPQIKTQTLNGNPNSIDYLVINATFGQELDGGNLPFLAKAKESLQLIQSFPVSPDPQSQKQLQTLPYTIEDVSIFGRPQTLIAAPDPAKLTPKQRLGQIFILGLEGTTLNPTENSLLQEGLLGGALLLKCNLASSSQLDDLTTSIYRQNQNPLSPFVAVNQDGGILATIRWFNSMTPAYTKSVAEAQEIANTRSNQLLHSGINLILGPIVDQSPDPG